MAKRTADPTGTPVAIKRLKKSVLIRQKQADHIVSERKVLSVIKHPFVVSVSSLIRSLHLHAAFCYFRFRFKC